MEEVQCKGKIRELYQVSQSIGISWRLMRDVNGKMGRSHIMEGTHTKMKIFLISKGGYLRVIEGF